jgi:hypothetical protein
MTHISIKRYAPTDWTVEERDWGVYTCINTTRARGISRSLASSIGSGPKLKRSWNSAYINKRRIQPDDIYEATDQTDGYST